MPPAILPKSNLRSLFDSLIVFQPGGRCLVSYAHEIGPLNFECGIRLLVCGEGIRIRSFPVTCLRTGF